MSTLSYYQLSPRAVIGQGAVKECAALVRDAGLRRPLLVTDAGLVACGVVERVIAALKPAEVDVRVFDRVKADPDVATVEAAAAYYREADCDSLIAVGGGSSMDAAKATGVVVSHPGRLMEYEGVGKLRHALPFMIAVPTTYGTGSEATNSAVITDPQRTFKAAILGPQMVPQIAVIDPELMMSLPRGIACAVSLDALSHAVESYVSRHATDLSECLALRATRLIGRHIGAVMSCSATVADVQAMATASFLAGMAFCQSRLGLVHAMAHPLGAYGHLPHGLCCAVLMPAVIRYNLAAAQRKYAELADALEGGTGSGRNAADLIEGLLATAGISPRLSDHGVKLTDIAAMVVDTMRSGNVQANPRSSDAPAITGLFEEIAQ